MSMVAKSPRWPWHQGGPSPWCPDHQDGHVTKVAVAPGCPSPMVAMSPWCPTPRVAPSSPWWPVPGRYVTRVSTSPGWPCHHHVPSLRCHLSLVAPFTQVSLSQPVPPLRWPCHQDPITGEGCHVTRGLCHQEVLPP